jgi:hypothetical protein
MKWVKQVDEQKIQMIALQACGEYMMRHIAGIMGIVQDKRLRNKDEVLDEKTLVIIEAHVKAIAEGLSHGDVETKGYDR